MRRSGQGATEYLLVISVLTLGVGAAAYTFVPAFGQGTLRMSRDVSQILATSTIGSTSSSTDANGDTTTSGSTLGLSRTGGAANTGGGGTDGDGACHDDRCWDSTRMPGQDGIPYGTQACTEYAIAGILGAPPKAILDQATAGGYTNSATDARITLANARRFLSHEYGVASTETWGAGMNQLEDALAKGDQVMVVMTWDKGDGQGGPHTVRVNRVYTEMRNGRPVTFVEFVDDWGEPITMNAKDFENAWREQGNGMLAVPPGQVASR